MPTVVEKVKGIARKVSRTIGEMGMATEMIPDTDEYEKRAREVSEAQEVFQDWDEGETVYSQLYNDLQKNRDFYLGEQSQQWDASLNPDGNLRLIFNIGATTIDLFTYILSNNPPYVQFIADDSKPLAILKANFSEEFTKQWMHNAKTSMRFRDGVKTQFMMGYAWPFLVWNPNNKEGGEKGTLEWTNLNLFTTRVKYASNDYSKIESFITVKRLTPRQIKKDYNFDALPDTEVNFLPKTISPIDDGKVNVFNWYNDNERKTVINGRVVNRKVHNYGFIPIKQVNNILVMNDAHGKSEIPRWRSICQELNALLSAASEIARDLAYPPILEYNNALAGRKIPKWRGQKIPIRRSDKGEAVSFMLNTAQIKPLLEQTKLLLDLFHFVSLMPKAAAGIFENNITSGFQAKLAMNPVTLVSEGRKVDWNDAFVDLVRMAFRIFEKENPEVFKMDLEGKEFKFEGLDQQRIEIIWPDNLPMDIAREIQNLILGIQNNLTSVTQAIDKYNVLMGLGNPTDTEELLKKEAEDPNLNPERAAKVAEVKTKLAQLGQTINAAGRQLNNLRGELNNGQQPTLPAPAEGEPLPPENPTNLVRGAASPLPEEQKPNSQTPESIALESTGGVLPNGGRA
jgi:hypothetical protein